MRPLHLENSALQQLQVVQLVPVDQFRHYITVGTASRALKSQDELLEGRSDLFHRDVGAVDEGRLIAGLRVAVLHVWRCVGIVKTVVEAVGQVEVGARLGGSATGSVPCVAGT